MIYGLTSGKSSCNHFRQSGSRLFLFLLPFLFPSPGLLYGSAQGGYFFLFLSIFLAISSPTMTPAKMHIASIIPCTSLLLYLYRCKTS